MDHINIFKVVDFASDLGLCAIHLEDFARNLEPYAINFEGGSFDNVVISDTIF